MKTNKAYWKIDNPGRRIFALIYCDDFQYQIAQYEPKFNSWSFYYSYGMITLPDQDVIWREIPKVPDHLRHTDSKRDKYVYELED